MINKLTETKQSVTETADMQVDNELKKKERDRRHFATQCLSTRFVPS